MKFNNNAPRENYFQQNIAKFGQNFIRSKSVKDIQKDAKRRLFKDMVYGNIDYDEYGIYFTDPQFIDNLIVVAHTLQEEHAVIANGLRLMAGTGNAIASQLYVRHSNVAYVFSVIEYNLGMVKANNYDIRYLVNIVPATIQCRNDFSEIY